MTQETWDQSGQARTDEQIEEMGQSLQPPQSADLGAHVAKIPDVLKTEAENPGGHQAIHIEAADKAISTAHLATLQVGDAIPFPMGPTRLYVDDRLRFAGAVVEVNGRFGISILLEADESTEPKAPVAGQQRVAVELGRGWIKWDEERKIAGGDVVVQFPNRIDESPTVRVDGERWGKGTLHVSGEGYVLKLTELNGHRNMCRAAGVT